MRYILIAFVCLTLAACSRTIYNVQYITNPNCDTTHGQLFMRIINEGKLGISSFRLRTDSGWMQFGAVIPHDTTCYFPISPVYSNPLYEIYMLRFNSFGKITNVTKIGVPIDHIGETKFTSGYCTLHLSVTKKKRKLRVQNFRISKK